MPVRPAPLPKREFASDSAVDLFVELRARIQALGCQTDFALYQIDPVGAIARPEYFTGAPVPWLDLSRANWTCAQRWEDGTWLPELSGNDGLKICHLVPLMHRGATFGALVTFDSEWHSDTEVDAMLQRFATAWYHLQRGIELTRWHTHDARRLGAIADTTAILGEPDLDRLLAKLLEMSLTMVGAEVGCVALCEDDGSTSVRAAWGLEDEHLDALRVPNGDLMVDSVLENEDPITCWSPRHLRGNAHMSPGVHSLVGARLEGRDGNIGVVILVNADEDDDDSLALLQTVARLTSTVIEKAMLHALELREEAMREQLRVAGEIQSGLLPSLHRQTHQLEIAGRALPCDDAGGDFFDYFDLPDGRLCFMLGDATGHGIGAALLATTARASLRALVSAADGDIDLGDVVTRLNTLADADFALDRFITLCVCVLDPHSGELTYVNAGHDPPMLVLRADGKCDEEFTASGPPIGVLPHIEFLQDRVPSLSPGDRIVLASDGIHEAINCKEEQFGKQRTREVIAGNMHLPSAQLIDTLLHECGRFRGTAAQHDDVTMLCVAMVGSESTVEAA